MRIEPKTKTWEEKDPKEWAYKYQKQSIGTIIIASINIIIGTITDNITIIVFNMIIWLIFLTIPISYDKWKKTKKKTKKEIQQEEKQKRWGWKKDRG